MMVCRENLAITVFKDVISPKSPPTEGNAEAKFLISILIIKFATVLDIKKANTKNSY